MAKAFGAAKLIELVAFDQRDRLDDGYGNKTAGEWREIFRDRAAFITLKGGSETVMQRRLEGHPSVICRLRRHAQSEAVATDWRMRDTRTGTIYNVRAVTADLSRALIDVLCEANVGG